MNLPVYKITPILDDDNYFEIAILDNPAIEEFALLFNQELNSKFKVENEEKQIMVGPALIPNKLIPRNDSLGQRYVTFDEQAIEDCVKLFFKKGFVFNFAHSNRKIDVDILESYFAKENNEFDVPAGSWIVKIHINEKEFWNEIKNKKMGFSIESFFSNIFINNVEIKNKKENNMNVKEKLLEFINTTLFAETPVVEPVIEPVPDVVKEEIKDVVEEVKEEVIKEIVDEVVVEKEYVTKEEINKLFEDMLVKVGEMIKENNPVEQIEEMKQKIEEFGKQPLAEPIKEVIEKESTIENKYEFLKNIKK